MSACLLDSRWMGFYNYYCGGWLEFVHTFQFYLIQESNGQLYAVKTQAEGLFRISFTEIVLGQSVEEIFGRRDRESRPNARMVEMT
jgi:hypothetical protein